MRKNYSKFDEGDLSIFFKQLASLLKAGLPLYRALQVIAGQNEKIKALVLKAANNIADGKSFAKSLKIQGVSDYLVSLVDMAEKNAVLESTLVEIAEHLETQMEAKKKIKRTLAYPAIVLFSSLLCLMALIVIILPMFSSMFDGFNVPLPFITQVLLQIPKYSWLILVLFAGIVYAGFYVWKRDDLRLRVPVLGGIQRSFILERFCRTLGQQLKNGVPILEAVSVTKQALPNSVYRSSMDAVYSKLEQGEGLAKSLDAKLFPEAVLQIAAVGEETSTLHSMLVETANFYLQEAQTSIKQVTMLVEPLSTLLVGGVVAMVAFAMLSPLFAMMNSLQ